MSSKKQRAVEALAEFANNDVRCDDCGKPATCIGSYEGQKETFPCCDACCGHGNEDGWCVLLSDLDAESVLEFSPPGPVVLLPHQRTTALAAIISSRLRMDAIDERDKTIAALRAQVDTLTKQLVAATNDAARAELRARDAMEVLKGQAMCGCDPESGCHQARIRAFIASPDSDARLREVMRAAWVRGTTAWSRGLEDAHWVQEIDEALGVKS